MTFETWLPFVAPSARRRALVRNPRAIFNRTGGSLRVGAGIAAAAIGPVN